MNASKVLTKKQLWLLIVLLAVLAAGFAVDYLNTAIVLLSILTVFYLVNIVFSFHLTWRSIFYSKEIKIDSSRFDEIHSSYWPRYTILCPLYKEANILPDFVESIERLDYPKDRLECLLLLESDDRSTIQAAKELNLPPHFKIVEIPDSQPKTKPKACNIGLALAKGDFVVIYDAEDQAEPDQLKKAVVAFYKSESNVACIQAKLNFYNPGQNILTKLFTSEYTLWFDLILPGLQSIDAPIPLGGTSNHFRKAALAKLGGWDPYNVTEDCDLGVRLKLAGYKTEILDSITYEEANSNLKNWLRQRSRWVKGYFQTFLVHTRKPIRLIREMGPKNSLIFVLVSGFLPFANLVNPLFWATTIAYFVFRPQIGGFIEMFFPPVLLYLSVICLILGNFLFIYNYLVAAAKKGFDRYTKYGLLMPLCWLLISMAGWYALFQLILKPHYWEKTKHGLMKKEHIHV